MRPRLTTIGQVPLVLAFVYLVAPGLMVEGGVGAVIYPAIALLCLIVMAAAIWVRGHRTRWYWLTLLLALGTRVIGDLVAGSEGDGSTSYAADGWELLGAIAMIGALLHIARRRLRGSSSDRLMDVAVASVAASFVVCELVVRPMWELEHASLGAILVASMHPIVAVILLVIVIQIALSPGRKPAALALLIGAALAQFAASIGSTVTERGRPGGPEHPALDGLWLMSYALLALAACTASSSHTDKPGGTARRVAMSQVVVSVGALLSLPVVVSVGHALGRPPLAITMAFTTGVMVTMIGLRFVLQARDIDNTNRRLQVRETYYRALATHSSDVYVVVDDQGRVLDASVGVMSLLGPYSPEEFRASPLDFIRGSDRALVTAAVDDARTRPGRSTMCEARFGPSGGDERWVELRCTNLTDDEAVGGIVINVHEITARKQVESELEHQAFHDSLTGLANRALFRDRVEHALSRRSRLGGDVAVLFCDLDDFKSVNDSLGHAAGDDLLRRAAPRFANAVRAGDTVARLGGDEFGVLLEGDAEMTGEAELVAGRILRALADPMELGDSIVISTGSVGLATASQGADTADELLRNADLAMYGSKQAGRNTVTRYEPGMAVAVVNRHDLGIDLRTVVERNELFLQYQPVVELASRRLVGFEALVRWRHPQRGLLMPDEFIPIAEDTGLIVPIGEWVLRSACTAAAGWPIAESDTTGHTVAVNVSARQLQDPTLPARFAMILRETGLEPCRVVLELTESVLVHEPAEAASQLRSLKRLGVRLAIDDFGTGYSSLSYLRQFPVDIVKIDQSFIESVTGEHVPAITHGLLELGRSLSLTTVAEGIEDEAQVAALAAEGCDFGQGYAIGRPLDETAAHDLAGHGVVPDLAPSARPPVLHH